MYDWSFLMYPTSKSFFKNTFLPQITKDFLYFPAKSAFFVLCRLYHPFFSIWRTCWKLCFPIHYHHLLHLTPLFFFGKTGFFSNEFLILALFCFSMKFSIRTCWLCRLLLNFTYKFQFFWIIHLQVLKNDFLNIINAPIIYFISWILFIGCFEKSH